MHGILQFKDSQAEGSFRPYRRTNTTRTKTGCLSCRIRHTKCDEQRPVCNACVRNHLLCSWPNEPRAYETQSPLHPSQSCQSPPRRSSLQAYSPNSAFSPWPRLQGKPAEQRLLHHYLERSSQRLIVRDGGHNPFVAYLLPLAQHNDGLLHAVLAISASHLSLNDPTAHLAALSHYAVSLRAVKYLITEFGNGFREHALQIVLLLVALCAFEVMDGNTQGAVMHHWGSCSALLFSQTNLLKDTDDGCARFLAEQYMYIGLINEHLGLMPPSESRESSQTVILDLSSYYRDWCSSCAFALFEIIPHIASLARKPSKASTRYLDPEIITEFHALEQRILSWTVPKSTYSIPGYSAEPNEDEVKASIVQQLALLVTLQCALHGPGVPGPPIKDKIDCCIFEATSLMKQISPPSAAWGMLLWPFAHLGSCITSKEAQDEFVAAIRGIDNQVRGSTMFVSLLLRLWETSREEERFYGPYGIQEFMAREGLRPSLG